ncbi:hypothetical protein [Mycobacterium sp. UM_Kg1]|uniref:hypothetical protein n=1 Tax=Mycobacterium sp. UM_Kg1 TaxID=1545691 RepID=UPI00061AA4F1|nr:hypothetical protein [Mycobacterium sp. UM_Kg1]
MSFLLDPPMLVAAGVLIEREVDVAERDLAEAAVLGTFFGASFGLYNNVPGLGIMWRPFGSRNGRDFMWNSGILRLRTESLGWRAHAVAAVLFATYPFFLKSGRRLGRRRSPRPLTLVS